MQHWLGQHVCYEVCTQFMLWVTGCFGIWLQAFSLAYNFARSSRKVYLVNWGVCCKSRLLHHCRLGLKWVFNSPVSSVLAFSKDESSHLSQIRWNFRFKEYWLPFGWKESCQTTVCGESQAFSIAVIEMWAYLPVFIAKKIVHSTYTIMNTGVTRQRLFAALKRCWTCCNAAWTATGWDRP